IVNGQNAKSGDAPFTVRILFSGYLCTGSLLSTRHVLTAGHCVTDENSGSVYSPSVYTVQVGGITTSTLRSYRVSKVSRNPDWDPNTLTGDLGILTLSSAITTGTNAQPAKIFTGTINDRDTVRAFGWGQTSSGGVPSTLQTASLTVGDTADCQAQNSGYDGPNGIWTCTELSLNGGNRAVCFGDSGGPL
ncbi:trypsin-like serine protease, partial [Ramicandelaber brevisporus]